LEAVDRVVLLGVRLGALLAARAAADRKDIAGFIAVAPVVSGRAYLRELRALQITLGLVAAPDGEPKDGASEAVGFRITRETHETLSKIDLAREGVRPSGRVLIVDRDDLPFADNWAQRLRDASTDVDLRRLPGYTEMVLDPHKTKVPDAIIAASVGWLRETIAKDAPPAIPAGTSARAAVDISASSARIVAGDGPAVVETAAYLDGDRTVFGMLTAPAAEATDQIAPGRGKAVLLLNSGSIHHVGPNRLYVTLARRWAAMGYVVLRADVSGIGDSRPRPGEPENVVYTARAMEDIDVFLGHLRRQPGVGRIYVAGLCSGAYNAVRAAAAGKPVDVVIPINPLTFFWKEGMSLDYPAHRVAADAQRYSTSILRLESWKKVLRGQVKLEPVAQVVVRHAASRASRYVRDVARVVGRPFPEDLGADLERINGYGARLRFVFAAGDPGEELLRTQGGSAVGRLRRKGALSVDVIDGPDHTFTPVWTHRILGDRLTAILRDLPG
jgi:alpha/beta superfamily hydrolase